MPYLGTLLLKGNILRVKLNDTFSKTSNIPEHRFRTIKDIELFMETEEDKKVSYNNIKDVDKAL